jgi:unsaturated chondroitin disaccharide hydrolase
VLADALDDVLARLDRSLPAIGAARGAGLLPHVTEGGRWELLSPLAREREALTGLPWTGGFVAGQLWLAAALTGRDDFAAEAAAVTELLAPRAAQPTTHDLGFLFWPSAVLGYRATGEERYRALGLRAAESLVERLLPAGVIQLIGTLDDPELRGRTIADTFPNLLLLWWAEREGAAEAGAAARAHLAASVLAYMRPDGSTFHAVRFTDDGRVLERGTINGFSADSTWARGQAWTMHGLASAWRATRDPELRATADRTATNFVERLPPDGIPPWDFDAPPGGPRDASSAAIAASALLELGRDEEAHRLLVALAGECVNRGPDDGLLLHCCYRYSVGKAVDSATSWGDFFLLDALARAVAPERRLDPLAG